MAVLKNKIELKNVSKVYETRDKQVEVLNNLSFEVHENEFLALLGPGRCGKTVLLNILANLEKQTSGTIEFAGGRPKMGDLGMVFQKYALFPWKTVMGNVEMSQKLKGVDKKVRQEKAQEYINLVGLKGFENSLPKQLSGGMKQRVGIARAYASESDILLLDEPFGALDAQTRYQMEDEIIKIWEKNKKTIIFVTNNVEEALYLGDRILLLSSRPAEIKKEYVVDLPRPRSYTDKAFLEYRQIWIFNGGQKMSDDTKVKVVGLTKKFGDLLVLNDISFNVKKGDFVCIVGPTGCGKTTFLNLLVKLIEPTSGQILIDGEPADPKKHNIAFVFQEPSAYPWLTVEENLQYGLKIKKVDQKTIEERTKEIAESLGLTEVLKSYPRELSASLEQRVVIGRSFALHPDLLLMDEPYAQMDIKVRYYLEDQVIKLWQKTGSTVLFITHNIEEAVYLSEKCLILSQKPTTIKEEKIIDLPRPRDIASPEFIELREYVTKQIKWW